MKLYKALIALSLTLLTVLGFCALGEFYGPEYYEEAEGEYYMVTSENCENGKYILYMYPRPSSSGNPISEYENFYVLKVLDYYPDGDQTYALAVGPDGYVGYVRKAWITNLEEMEGYLPYVVDSEYSEKGKFLVYMYPTPSSGGRPIGTYYNGDILFMIDPYATSSYSKVMAPDGTVGYVLSRRIKEF